MEYRLINGADNVKVSLENGHKYAARDIKRGEAVIKYGFPIGEATEDISEGAHVHTHNMKTGLSGLLEYRYSPDFAFPEPVDAVTVNAYVRKNGGVGIRNDIWIIPTVGCVNGIARKTAEMTGAFCFTHPYGCSQLGGDRDNTIKTLCGLIKNPNAGGVLVLGLGCENNGINDFKRALGDYDPLRIRFINAQDCEDELTECVSITEELKELVSADKRSPVPISSLKLGLKCGGSDGLSGITANPLCGQITDRLVAMGGTAVLTEVPEMFGAEQLLMDRCVSREVFEDTVKLIDRSKNTFISLGLPVSENPSPGNREGGITTLEEKSLGCVQKGGKAPVTAVLDIGETAKTPGLELLDGPGNDLVAITGLAAAGCQLILFTTGRGTPLGAPVPTIKIATNTVLAEKKKHWIDFDAQKGGAEELFSLITDTVNGRPTKNELAGLREIAILKTGATL